MCGRAWLGELYKDASLLEEVCFLLNAEGDLGLFHTPALSQAWCFVCCPSLITESKLLISGLDNLACNSHGGALVSGLCLEKRADVSHFSLLFWEQQGWMLAETRALELHKLGLTSQLRKIPSCQSKHLVLGF